MKLLTIKTTRFSRTVEKCGKPQVYTLWQKTSIDRHLQAQIKKSRVMTILKSDSGTDFGIVRLHCEQHTYGGDQVSTWSVLRLSCRSRSPVGLVKQPGNQRKCG